MERWIARVTLAYAWVAIPALILTTTLNVVGRRFALIDSEGIYDLGGAVFFGLVMLSFGYTYLRDGHVRVDVVRARRSARWLAWVEVAGCLAALLPLSVFLVHYGARQAWLAFVQGERSAAVLGYPLQWLVKGAVPLGFALLGLAGLCVTARNLRFLAGKAPGPAPSHHDD